MSGPNQLKEKADEPRLPFSGSRGLWSRTATSSAEVIVRPEMSFSDAKVQREWESLAKEKDPEMYFEGLLSFAQRLEDKGQSESAAKLYQGLSGAPGRTHRVPDEIQNRAQDRLNALRGRGHTGRRVEVLFKNLVQDATSYRMILPMLAGSALGQVIGVATLGRLSQTVRPAWWSRGLGAKFLSGLAGYAAEALLFAQLNRSLSGSSGPFTADLARSAITLGTLRTFGWAGQFAGLAGIPASAARIALSRSPTVISQASIFFGLWASHHFEESLGLRPVVDGATRAADIFASMLSLGVGSHLGRKLLGPGFAAFQNELALRSSSRASAPEDKNIRVFFPSSSVLSTASVGEGLGRGPVAKGARIQPAGTFDFGLSAMMEAGDAGGSGGGTAALRPSRPPDVDGALYDSINSYDWRAPSSETNEVYDAVREREGENLEIGRLHHEILKTGARLLVDTTISLETAIADLHRGDPLLVLGAQGVFDSQRWGPVDLRALAERNPLKYYPGNIRQAELYRDLSILLKRPDLSIGRLRKLLGPDAAEFFLERHWNNISISWKHFLWLRHRLDLSAYQGDEGYARFSEEHFKGHPHTAWSAVRPLFETRREMKRRTAWPMMKQTHLDREPELGRELVMGIRHGHLIGEEGYDLFAGTFFNGDPRLAWNAARTLLTAEGFRRLHWPVCKTTNVFDQEGMRRLLRQGLADGSYQGEAGYDAFARNQFGGYSQSAWAAAKTLLPAEEFVKLGWRIQKVTKVQDQEYIRRFLEAGLKSGELRGEEGYNCFARIFFRGFSGSAWRAAKSLLCEGEFLALGWRPKVTYLHEEDEFRSILREGLKNGEWFGEKGLERYAEQYWSADPGRAWDVARSVLTEVEFLLLAWETPGAGGGGLEKEGSQTRDPLFFGGYFMAQKTPPLDEEVVQRFLHLLAAKPRTLGRRLLRLIEMQRIEDLNLKILLIWFAKILDEIPHIPRRVKEKGDSDQPASPSSDPPEPPSGPLPPEPPDLSAADKTAIQKSMEELEKDPHAEAESLFERVQGNFGDNPAVQLLLAYLKKHLGSIPKKAKKKPSDPPEGGSGPISPRDPPGGEDPPTPATDPSGTVEAKTGEVALDFTSFPELPSFYSETFQPIPEVLRLLQNAADPKIVKQIENLLWNFDPPAISATPNQVSDQLRPLAERFIKFSRAHSEEIRRSSSVEGLVAVRALQEEFAKAIKTIWELEIAEQDPIAEGDEKTETLLTLAAEEEQKKPLALVQVRTPIGSIHSAVVNKVQADEFKVRIKTGATVLLEIAEGQKMNFKPEDILSIEDLGAFHRLTLRNYLKMSEPSRVFYNFLALVLGNPKLAEVEKLIEREQRRAGALIILGSNSEWIRAVLARRLLKVYQEHRKLIQNHINYIDWVYRFPEIAGIHSDSLKTFIKKLAAYMGKNPKGAEQIRSWFDHLDLIPRIYFLLGDLQEKNPELAKTFKAWQARTFEEYQERCKERARVYWEHRKELLPFLSPFISPPDGESGSPPEGGGPPLLPPFKNNEPASSALTARETEPEASLSLDQQIGLLPELRGGGPPLEGDAAWKRLWQYFSTKKLPEALLRKWVRHLDDLKNTFQKGDRVPSEKLARFQSEFYSRLGRFYLENGDPILHSPEVELNYWDDKFYWLDSFPESEKEEVRRKFPETELVSDEDLQDLVSAKIGEEPVVLAPTHYGTYKIFAVHKLAGANKEVFKTKEFQKYAYFRDELIRNQGRWAFLAYGGMDNPHHDKVWSQIFFEDYQKFRPAILALLARSPKMGLDRVLSVFPGMEDPVDSLDFRLIKYHAPHRPPAETHLLRFLYGNRFNNRFAPEVDKALWGFDPPHANATPEEVGRKLQLHRDRLRKFAVSRMADLIDNMDFHSSGDWEQVGKESLAELEDKRKLFGELLMPNRNSRSWKEHYQSWSDRNFAGEPLVLMEIHIGSKGEAAIFHQVIPLNEAEEIRQDLRTKGRSPLFIQGETVKIPADWFKCLETLQPFFLLTRQILSRVSDSVFEAYALAKLLSDSTALKKLQIEMEKDIARAGALILLGGDPGPIAAQLEKRIQESYKRNREDLTSKIDFGAAASTFPEIQAVAESEVQRVLAAILPSIPPARQGWVRALMREEDTATRVVSRLLEYEEKKPGSVDLKKLKAVVHHDVEWRQFTEKISRYYVELRPEIQKELNSRSS